MVSVSLNREQQKGGPWPSWRWVETEVRSLMRSFIHQVFIIHLLRSKRFSRCLRENYSCPLSASIPFGRQVLHQRARKAHHLPAHRAERADSVRGTQGWGAGGNAEQNGQKR